VQQQPTETIRFDLDSLKIDQRLQRLVACLVFKSVHFLAELGAPLRDGNSEPRVRQQCSQRYTGVHGAELVRLRGIHTQTRRHTGIDTDTDRHTDTATDTGTGTQI
jgi:hypothetical protein